MQLKYYTFFHKYAYFEKNWKIILSFNEGPVRSPPLPWAQDYRPVCPPHWRAWPLITQTTTNSWRNGWSCMGRWRTSRQNNCPAKWDTSQNRTGHTSVNLCCLKLSPLDRELNNYCCLRYTVSRGLLLTSVQQKEQQDFHRKYRSTNPHFKAFKAMFSVSQSCWLFSLHTF